MGTHLVHLLAVLEEDERREGSNAVLGRQRPSVLVLLGIDLETKCEAAVSRPEASVRFEEGDVTRFAERGMQQPVGQGLD